MTFHNGEQNELDDVTKNTKLETIWPIKNHPLELWHSKTKLKARQESMWDPTIKKIGTKKLLQQNSHTKESEIDRL
jgi:hypothetical protein